MVGMCNNARSLFQSFRHSGTLRLAAKVSPLPPPPALLPRIRIYIYINLYRGYCLHTHTRDRVAREYRAGYMCEAISSPRSILPYNRHHTPTPTHTHTATRPSSYDRDTSVIIIMT